MCIDTQERAVLGKGATHQMVHNVVRIAAIVHGVAATLDAEAVFAAAAQAAPTATAA
jgi:alkyl hydroperoxide reductase subunit D